jgi:hypothetical protein
VNTEEFTDCRSRKSFYVFWNIPLSHDNLAADRTQVTCVDVTSGGLGVSSDSDGQLAVWTTDTGEVRVSTYYQFVWPVHCLASVLHP